MRTPSRRDTLSRSFTSAISRSDAARLSATKPRMSAEPSASPIASSSIHLMPVSGVRS